MRLTSLKLELVEDLFLEELRDLYDAESQLLKALPKLAEAATAPALKVAFSQHLEETKGHVGRLDRVFRELDAKPWSRKGNSLSRPRENPPCVTRD